MGLLNFLLGGGARDRTSDEDFDRKLKECDKKYAPIEVERQKLIAAEYHASVKSAFWWYEHLPTKPNTGSDSDIYKLHNKFKRSLEPEPNHKNKVVTREIQLKFLDLVLPNDEDYSGIQDNVNTKSEFIEAIMKLYEMARKKSFNWSPFLIPQYWILYHRDESIDENGELIRDENGEIAQQVWLRRFRETFGLT